MESPVPIQIMFLYSPWIESMLNRPTNVVWASRKELIYLTFSPSGILGKFALFLTIQFGVLCKAESLI